MKPIVLSKIIATAPSVQTGSSSSGSSSSRGTVKSVREESKDEKLEELYDIVVPPPVCKDKGLISYPTRTFATQRDYGTAVVNLKSKKSAGSLSISLPPPLRLTHRVTKTLRFVSSGTFAVSVGVGDLVGACGGMCTVINSELTCWASSFKLHAIRMWPAVDGTAGSSGHVDWFFTSGSYSFPDDSTSLTLPEGVTTTGCYTFKPPTKSLCGDWVNIGIGATANLFNIAHAVKGTIIEVDVTYTLGLVTSTFASLITATITTGALGNIYYLALDGPSSNVLGPVPGVPTTH